MNVKNRPDSNTLETSINSNAGVIARPAVKARPDSNTVKCRLGSGQILTLQ